VNVAPGARANDDKTKPVIIKNNVFIIVKLNIKKKIGIY
jgi:hypothetical protein